MHLGGRRGKVGHATSQKERKKRGILPLTYGVKVDRPAPAVAVDVCPSLMANLPQPGGQHIGDGSERNSIRRHVVKAQLGQRGCDATTESPSILGAKSKATKQTSKMAYQVWGNPSICMALNTIRTCAVETGCPIRLVNISGKSISCSDSRDVGTMATLRVAVVAVSRSARLEVAVSYNLPVTDVHAVHDAGSSRPETCDAHTTVAAKTNVKRFRLTLASKRRFLASDFTWPIVWCGGTVVQWCSGALVQWCSGGLLSSYLFLHPFCRVAQERQHHEKNSYRGQCRCLRCR